MAKPPTTDEPSRVAGLIADILPQLDEDIVSVDAAADSAEIGVTMASGQRLRVKVTRESGV